MYIRSYAFLILFLLFAVYVQADEFVTLRWYKTTSEDVRARVPGFEGAVCLNDSKLPVYTRDIELGRDYALFDYEVKIGYPEFEPVSKNEKDSLVLWRESLNDYPVASTSLVVSAKSGILQVQLVPLVLRNGNYMRVKSFKFTLNKKNKLSRSAKDPSYSDRYTSQSVLSSGRWVKIRIGETGVHQITNSELSGMGFTNPDKVRLYGYGGRVLPEILAAPQVDDLQEVPLWREKNYVLFYAYGPISWSRLAKTPLTFTHTQNYYSSYGYYFLTESEKAPMAFPEIASLPDTGAKTVSTFPDYSLYEKDAFSWFPAGRRFFDDYDYKVSNTKSYTINSPGIVDGNADFTVAFSANSTTSGSTVTINVNGEENGKFSISAASGYTVAGIGETTCAWNGNKTEKATVKLTFTSSSTVSGHLDFIRLNYTRALSFAAPYLSFRTKKEDKIKFLISGSNESVRVWNVGNVKSFHAIKGILSDNKIYSVVVDGSAEDEYVAVDVKGTGFKKVEVVGAVANQNLHKFRGIEMVIITPPNSGMMAQAERLAEAHREKDGMTVQVVTSEQIYNEFSSGTPDATAYRRFMKMLYDCAQTYEEQPKYLLLFGDAAWDNRMLTTSWRKYNPKDFLLCYESENSLSHTASYVLEDYFGYLEDGKGGNHFSDVMDIGVGRFPVRTVEQASKMVDKTINYIYNKEAGSWKNMTCFLGDDEDGDNRHLDDVAVMAKVVEKGHKELLVKKIYWDAYKRESSASGNSYPEAKRDALEQIKNGALIIAYAGHANPTGLSHEWVLDMKDVKTFTSARHAVWLTMGCDVGPFDSAEESFGEELFLNERGGAIAALVSTRTTYPGVGRNQSIGEVFIQGALAKDEIGNPLRLGDAIRKTRYSSKVSNTANKVQYVLLGDPALALSSYKHEVVVDEFNGEGLDTQTVMKAGSKVTVKGRVLDGEGQTDTSFNGLVFPTVMDHLETFKTLGNAGNPPFIYESRTRKLYNGGDSIRSGEFSFTFPVPMDISYSMESGLVNFYAIDNLKEKEAKGKFENFLVGGTDEGAMSTDSLGPKISLYLNSPEFQYGGEVNEAPMLVADLEDEDGINSTGGGIGHDIMVTIDNSPVNTYVLNSYYTPEFGDYTRGSLRYRLPELAEGKHTLMLRVWDIKNNSSTSQLEFTVKHGARPKLFDIDCVSPARTSTRFVLSHDRPEAELDIEVGVFDFSGKAVWIHSETNVTSSSYYYIDWNLTGNGGQRLSPGVYLFRASISSGGSKESTKTRKLVILAQ